MTSYGFLARQWTHGVWADEACLSAAATVPPARLGEQFGFSFGSVHATLVHMLGAQAVWLGRLNGEKDPIFPDPFSPPTLKSIEDRWAMLHDEWRDYLALQTEKSLDTPVEFARRDMAYRSPVRVVLAHVFDHSTIHRGQLNSLIKLAGGTPFDYGQMSWSRVTGDTIEL